ncbi:MAG: hypothetical protein ACI8X5_002697 [Planctomycetota bacterium]|jgi:hypothetical protein
MGGAIGGFGLNATSSERCFFPHTIARDLGRSIDFCPDSWLDRYLGINAERGTHVRTPPALVIELPLVRRKEGVRRDEDLRWVDCRFLRRSIHLGKNNMIHRLVVTGLLVLGMSSTVMAFDGRNPGSLLIYPEFDNRSGTVTILTVTNIDTADRAASVDVEFVYVGRFNGPDNTDEHCREFNRTETLTPADTFTCLTDAHNPDLDQGYVYLFAKDSVTGAPIKHNYLTGNVITVDGFASFEFSVNPISYEGLNPNMDDESELLLDNVEYAGTPAEIVIPRFLGQNGFRQSELILLGLSGSRDDYTIVDFLIWNDNEEIFSSEYTFRCWERVHLTDISLIFDNFFLANFTNDDPNEIIGAETIESGWMHLQGALYGDGSTSDLDPSIYAVLIERVGSLGLADLPFEMGETLRNGALHRVITGP